MTELTAFTCDGCGDTLVPKSPADGLYSAGWFMVFGNKEHPGRWHVCSIQCFGTLANLLDASEAMSG